jgi:hypothetical protein
VRTKFDIYVFTYLNAESDTDEEDQIEAILQIEHKCLFCHLFLLLQS